MIFLLLLVCAGIGAAIRQPKGDPIAGFLCGLFLGPLGIVLALVWPATNRRTCPACAETVKNEAVVCRHCGRDLPPAVRTKV